MLPIGPQKEFGTLSNEARVTIQILHRYTALILCIVIPAVLYLQREQCTNGECIDSVSYYFK